MKHLRLQVGKYPRLLCSVRSWTIRLVWSLLECFGNTPSIIAWNQKFKVSQSVVPLSVDKVCKTLDCEIRVNQAFYCLQPTSTLFSKMLEIQSLSDCWLTLIARFAPWVSNSIIKRYNVQCCQFFLLVSSSDGTTNRTNRQVYDLRPKLRASKTFIIHSDLRWKLSMFI